MSFATWKQKWGTKLSVLTYQKNYIFLSIIMEVHSQICKIGVSLFIDREIFLSVHVVYVWVLHILKDSSGQLEPRKQ